MTIGEQIKFVRKSLGLTQKELGQFSNTSETTIKQYELGKRQPRIEQLQRIAYALGGSIDDIFVLDEEEAKLLNEADLLKIINAEITSKNLTPEEDKLLLDYRQLNNSGKTEAIKRVEELTEIKRYTE